MRARRFTTLVAGLCGTAFAALTAVNWLLDPTGLLGAAGWRDAAICAPGLRGDERTVKPFAASHARANTLLIGTSQVAVGFDPTDLPASWRDGGAFNLGISSATLQTVASFLPDVISRARPERLVLGLSPGMLTRERRGDTPNTGPGLMWKLKLLFTALVSYEAAEASMRMIFGDACRHPPSRVDGFRSRGFDTVRMPQRQGAALPAALARRDRPMDGRQELGAVLGELCRQPIEVFVVLTPHHLGWLAAYWRMPDRWGLFERFKIDVVETAARHRSDGCAIAVHDFNLPHAWASRPIGAADSVFMDATHFSPRIGKNILATIAAGASADGQPEQGGRLTPQNIAQHLAAQHGAMSQLMKESVQRRR